MHPKQEVLPLSLYIYMLIYLYIEFVEEHVPLILPDHRIFFTTNSIQQVTNVLQGSSAIVVCGHWHHELRCSQKRYFGEEIKGRAPPEIPQRQKYDGVIGSGGGPLEGMPCSTSTRGGPSGDGGGGWPLACGGGGSIEAELEFSSGRFGLGLAGGSKP